MVTTLKELRVEKGARLKDVSEVLGYKYPAGYHKIETGKQKLRIDQAEKLSNYYEVNPSIFFRN